MKKLLLASAVTLAGLSAIATASHADQKYCRYYDADVLCKSIGWVAQSSTQGLAIATNATSRRQTKYCRDQASYNDPICVEKVEYSVPVPEYVNAEESVYMEIEDPVYVEAEEPVEEASY